jgi:hypothetical protein
MLALHRHISEGMHHANALARSARQAAEYAA